MVKLENKTHNFEFDKISIMNIEKIIQDGLSFKEAVKTEIEFYIEKEKLQHRIFLSACRFYENIQF